MAHRPEDEQHDGGDDEQGDDGALGDHATELSERDHRIRTGPRAIATAAESGGGDAGKVSGNESSSAPVSTATRSKRCVSSSPSALGWMRTTAAESWGACDGEGCDCMTGRLSNERARAFAAFL